MISDSYAIKGEDLLIYSVLFENNPLPCLVIDDALKITKANHAASKYYDYTIPELEDLSIDQLLTFFGKLKFHQQLKNSLTLAWHDVFEQRRKTESVMMAELYVQSIRQQSGQLHFITAVDVTDKVMENEALKANWEQYTVFIEQSSEGIFLQELHTPIPIDLPADEIILQFRKYGYLAQCNHAMAAMYGYANSAELEGATPEQLFDFDDPANIQYFKTFIRNGFRVNDAESHELDKDGNIRYFLNNLIGVVENGQLKRVWGTQRDITDKKQTEDELHLLASLVEETSDVLNASDLDFRPITWNRAAEEIFGLSASQVIGRSLRDFISDIHYDGIDREGVKAIILEQGQWRGELVFTRPTDHKEVTLLVNFKLMTNAMGQPKCYVVAATDITQRKQSQLRLEESEKRFRDLADSAPVMIWMSSTENKPYYVNKRLASYLGIKEDDFTQENWWNALHPEDLAENVEKFNEHFTAQKPVTLIYRFCNACGEYRWVQDTSMPRLLDDGTFLGYIGTIIDIHETKEKEEQSRYQATLLANVQDSIITTDLEMKIKSWNKVCDQYFGLSAEEVIGQDFHKIVVFDFLDTTMEEALQVLQANGSWQGEVGFDTIEGDRLFFAYNVTFIRDNHDVPVGIMAVGRDITVQKRAEENLKRSESFYRALISDSLDGMILTNDQGMITFVSPSIRHILGFEPEEAIGRYMFEFVHPEDLAWAVQSFQREVEENPEIKFIHVRVLHKKGDYIWCMVRGHNLLSNPYVNSLAVYFHDDTPRRNAVEALKESEKRFRTLIEDLQMGVILQDPKGRILLCNKIVMQTLKAPEEEIIGKFVTDVISDPILENGLPFIFDERPINWAIRHQKPLEGLVMGIREPIKNERLWIMMNVNPVVNEAGEIIHIISTITDITERKRLESKLVQDEVKQQKLLTRATLEGQEKERSEIGKELHDNIGQQLTTTKLYLDLAKTTADDETMELICLALKSISDVINDVRGISRALTPHTLGDLGLVESVTDLIETLHRTQSIHVKLNYSEFDEEIVDDNQKLMLFRIIQEQLNNVVKHAQASIVRIKLKNNSPLLTLEISDDGKGFDSMKIRRGLGLTNIRNRAELFGGKMDIITAEGSGCTIRITVPTTVKGE